MLSIPKYPEQYAQHFPTIFYLLCCASQHHVWLVSTKVAEARATASEGRGDGVENGARFRSWWLSNLMCGSTHLYAGPSGHPSPPPTPNPSTSQQKGPRWALHRLAFLHSRMNPFKSVGGFLLHAKGRWERVGYEAGFWDSTSPELGQVQAIVEWWWVMGK